jgi:ABC-type molybdate transport system substrate-binding protein
VDTFPASTHEPIRYPAAATVVASAGAAVFLEFLSSESALAILDRAGFSRP